jgi:hypothetical protein
VKVRKLLGVQLDAQAMSRRSLEDPACLGGGKPDPVAKGIDRIGKSSAGDSRDHPFANLRDIIVGISLISGRKCVCPKEGGRNADRPFGAEPTSGAQHFDFLFERQSVARLYLDRRHAFGNQRIKARQSGLDKLGFRGFAGCHHRRHNTPACARYFLIACPGEA